MSMMCPFTTLPCLLTPSYFSWLCSSFPNVMSDLFSLSTFLASFPNVMFLSILSTFTVLFCSLTIFLIRMMMILAFLVLPYYATPFLRYGWSCLTYKPSSSRTIFVSYIFRDSLPCVPFISIRVGVLISRAAYLISSHNISCPLLYYLMFFPLRY
jgi:hypothetical protein